MQSPAASAKPSGPEPSSQLGKVSAQDAGVSRGLGRGMNDSGTRD